MSPPYHVVMFSSEYEKEWNRLTVQQKVTPRESKPRISRTKGHLSKRTAFVREIVKEVSGYVDCLSTAFGGMRGKAERIPETEDMDKLG